MSSGMGVRGSHIPGASGAVDPAKARDVKRTPQGTPIAKANQPATKTMKPKPKPKGGGKKR